MHAGKGKQCILNQQDKPKKKKANKKLTHKKKGAQAPQPLFDPTQRWHLDKEVDAELRQNCDNTVLI